MSYYILKQNLDEEVISKACPQVDCLTMFEAHSINSWYLFNPAPNLSFMLRHGANLTDVLQDFTINSRGFLISPKVKKVLNNFRLMRHQYFSAPVKTKDGSHNYSWLHLCDLELTHQINFAESVFFRTEFTFREEQIKLDSFDHYQELKSQDKTAAFGVELDEIVLSDKFDQSLDLFTFLPFDDNVYITQRLVNAFVDNDIQGFVFERTDKIRNTNANKSYSA
ncbi:hypothetical protein [Pontibacter kalidii]|uniref:hypothetical protein n=1 Tax=Pontibacter kalidii TaxID=2592049 RepID=UPI00225112CA|nr:hypothetical protein [Pontibacter kalidii]